MSSNYFKDLCEEAKKGITTLSGHTIINFGLSDSQSAYYFENNQHHILMLDGTDYPFNTFKAAAIFAIALTGCAFFDEDNLYNYVKLHEEAYPIEFPDTLMYEVSSDENK
jgi:hypothetical protein